MKFGVCIPHYGRPIEAGGLREMAVQAEQLGFDSVWVTDHIIVPNSVEIVYKDRMLDPLALLAHLAAVTSKISIGTSVVILPYRNPITVAKVIATVDVLSGGRVIFGAAAGWMEGEFQALGVPFIERGAVSDEALRVIKELWTSDNPSFKGSYFSFSDVAFSPRPVQQPHPPVWIGGRSRRAIRRAVELGDGWHPNAMTPDLLATELAYMQELSVSRGRPNPPEVSLRGTLRLADDPTNGQRAPFQGAQEEVIRDMRQFAALGVSHIALTIPGDSFGDIFRAMERFVREIKPGVQA